MKKLTVVFCAFMSLIALDYVGPQRDFSPGQSSVERSAIKPELPPIESHFADEWDTEPWDMYLLIAQQASYDLNLETADFDDVFPEIAPAEIVVRSAPLPRLGQAWTIGEETAYSIGYTRRDQYSGKDKVVIEPIPPLQWYLAHEWNLGVWGAYAFSGQQGRRHVDFDFQEADKQFDRTLEPVLLGDPVADHFLNSDDSWGGGADWKYFWSRYFGAGVEGFLLHTKEHFGAAALGTFTVRYPIGRSRFAPYGFAGVGIVWGGSHTSKYFFEFHLPDEDNELEFVENRVVEDHRVNVIGQFGTGIEMRLVRPSTMRHVAVGLIADFTWNLIGGSNAGDRDFGMTRFGLNFSY